MSDLTDRINPPSDFSIVEEYMEDQAPKSIHDAFNRIKSALLNQGAVANEPPTEQSTGETPQICRVCGGHDGIHNEATEAGGDGMSGRAANTAESAKQTDAVADLNFCLNFDGVPQTVRNLIIRARDVFIDLQ